MMATIGYIAFEPGAAAAMAPVWRKSGHAPRIGLSGAAAQHVPAPDAFSLEGRTEADPAWLDGIELLVMSATRREIESALIRIAAARSIPVIQVIDTWGNYRPRFLDGMAPCIVVPDDFAAKEAVADGIPRGRLAPIGNPAWDGLPPLPSGDAGTLAFLAQPLRRIFGEQLGYDEFSALELLRRTRGMHPDLIRKLIVVPHPAGDDTEGDEPRTTLALALAEAGMIAGMFTSALVDAVLGGRRVVSVQPGLPDRDRCLLSRRGWISRVGAPEAFPSALSTAADGRKTLAATMVGSTDRFLGLIEETVAVCASSA
jgi:hypothetical protein